MRTGIVVGSRGSKLALLQAESVVARLKEQNPGLGVSIHKIVTSGDRDRRSSLDRLGVAIFVKELEEALRDGRIDLAVHSLKDVPTELPPGLALLSVTEREDPRDVLVARAKLQQLPPGSKIGTGSLLRAVQLKQRRPDLEVCGIRGNVDTRLKKVASGEYDGVVVAAAGLHRLGWAGRITEYLPPEHFLPAAGQGALVIEARRADKDIADMVSHINHLTTWQSVTAERAFLLTLGGGCRAPIGALATVNGDLLRLEGMVASPGRQKVLRASEEGHPGSAEELGVILARRLLARGAAEFIAEVGR